MYDAERTVAVAHVPDHDPETCEVIDLVELLVSADHLVVDGVEMLDPPVYLGLDAGLTQVPEQLRRRPVYERLPISAPGGHEALDFLIAPGVEGGEGEVLELPLDRVDPKPVRKGGVDLQRLRRLPELRLALEVGDGPHIMQPVCELDNDDAHVATHRHDHLPQRLGLRLLQIPRRKPLELGDPVHDLGDLIPEPSR